MFDESYNRLQKQGQTDLHIQFWYNPEDIVATRYYSYEFLGKAGTADICLNYLGPSQKDKMIWSKCKFAFSQDTWGERRDENLKTLIYLGTYGLHIIHNAFEHGEIASGWNMKKLMSSLHNLYEELPSCANYNNITESNDKEFPMLFVSQRWMENEPVAKKIREISPKIVENVKYWKLLPKSKHPVYGKAGNNISYDHLVASINDPIIPVKMIFCEEVAKKLNEFLTLFQTDQPMAQFLGEAVADLVRFFMEKFILKSVMDKAHSSISLTKIDLNNVTKQKPSCMDLGFNLNNKIKLPKVRKKVTNMIVMLVRFKIEALDFLWQKCVLT